MTSNQRLGQNLTFGLLDHLGRAIVVGDYEGRPFPTELALAREQGVSRPVVREATKMLAAKGLLDIRSRRGSLVESPERWNLFDADVLRWLLARGSIGHLARSLNEVRMAIEPAAASLAARNADATQIATIAYELTRMRAAVPDLGELGEVQAAFHVAVLRASGNPFLLQFHHLATLARAPVRMASSDEKARGAEIERHAAVHAAIAAGDRPAAGAAMERLIEDMRDADG